MPFRTARAAAIACVLAGACATTPARAPELRVGTSGDYAPFSRAGFEATDPTGSDATDPQGFDATDPTGFDIEIARAFAHDAGLTLALARFRWPALLADLERGAFDVAMSGVTVRPERSIRGRFSVPVAASGAVVLTRRSLAAGGLAGLDRPEIRIAVNQGGHLERVAAGRFPRAQRLPLPENDAVRRALAEARVDAVVTDTLEAPHWLRSLPGVVRLGPFTRDRKAYLWRAGADPAAGEALDAWLLAREADGTLAGWRRRWLGAPGPATATPRAALIAALGERLALMPAVAEAKRAAGRAVRDRAREARVLDAAHAAVAREAARLGRAAPPRESIDAFYRAQIEAAVALQERVLGEPPRGAAGFDLGQELRPALLRIGDRIAWLAVRLERAPDPEADRSAIARELAPHGLGAEHAAAIARSLEALVAAQTRANARASRPASTGSISDTP